MTIKWHLRVRLFLSFPTVYKSGTSQYFFYKYKNWSLKSTTWTRWSLATFLWQRNADVPLPRFSDSDLPESDKSDGEDHGGLPDGEPGDHEWTDDPIFIQGEQSLKLRWWGWRRWRLSGEIRDNNSSPDCDETTCLMFNKHSDCMALPIYESEGIAMLFAHMAETVKNGCFWPI